MFGWFHTRHDSVLEAFEHIADSSNHEDCVTLEVDSAAGEFSLQYADMHQGGALEEPKWNLASYPPGTPDADLEVFDEGHGYVIYEAEPLEEPADVAKRALTLVEDVGESEVEVQKVTTMELATDNPATDAKAVFRDLKEAVRGVAR